MTCEMAIFFYQLLFAGKVIAIITTSVICYILHTNYYKSREYLTLIYLNLFQIVPKRL